MPSMLVRLFQFAALAISLDAYAINKCIDAAGKATFTDAPCAGHQKADTVTLSRPAMSNSASTADHERLSGWLDNQARDEKRDTLNRTITTKQREIEDLRGKMDAELATLRTRKNFARNNLAGATWEESLSTEMQAVSTRYNSQIDQDQHDIEAARSDLKALDAQVDQAKPQANAANRPGV